MAFQLHQTIEMLHTLKHQGPPRIFDYRAVTQKDKRGIMAWGKEPTGQSHVKCRLDGVKFQHDFRPCIGTGIP